MSPALESGTPASWFRDALGTARSSRARKVARGLTVGLAGYEIGKKAHGWAKGRVSYTVSIANDDETYDAVATWLTENLSSRARRSLVVKSRRKRANGMTVAPDEDSSTARPPVTELRAYYDGSTAQMIRIDGHRVSVKVEHRSGLAEGLTLTVNSGDWMAGMERIEFTAFGTAGRDAVVEFLAGLAEANADGPGRPRMYVATRWGSWKRLRETPSRSLATVILADGQQERIIADVERFLAAEPFYGRVGIPWHRGLLFHGPPGCGKTSLATALADHFSLDVYLIPLSDLDADVNLVQLLADVSERAVLVLEDIDVTHAAKTRDDAERKGITLSGLLNALDGLATPHGLVTIMTTNDLGSLDHALVRPGRADLIEEFGPLDDDQAGRLASLICGRRTDVELGHLRLTHAELLETAKPYLDDPDGAERAIFMLLQEEAFRV